MERLTMRDSVGKAFWVEPRQPGGGYRLTEDKDDTRRLDRLAAYEDTGLEPEEIFGLCSMSNRAKMADLLRLEEYQALGPIDHLRELAQAEKDGRLVVLPAHGRWMPFHSEIAGDIQYCSVCEIGFEERTDFCPHCGAKMDLLEGDAKKRRMQTMRPTDADALFDFLTEQLDKETGAYSKGRLLDQLLPRLGMARPAERERMQWMKMITSKRLKAEVVRLTYRVQELEERLCPCEQHDYVRVGRAYTMLSGISDCDVLCTLKCRRCGKTIKKYDWE